MTQDMYELRSQMLGWNWCPDNLILNERFRLRIASSVMFDWAHCYVNDGLADSEFGQCMKRLRTARTASTYEEIGKYVATFSFPAGRGDLTHLFERSANKNNYNKGSFTSTGSDLLTLAPVLLRYFTKVVGV